MYEKIIDYLKDFILNNKVICISLLFLLASLVGNIYFIGFKKCEECICPKCTLKPTKSKKAEKKTIKVDVKGEVLNPGVIDIEEGSIVDDALKKAGGATDKANLNSINLSKKLTDEMVVYVHSAEEENAEVLFSEATAINNGPSTNNTLININSASLEELMTLNGIGEAKANRIIEYRKTNPFKTIEDIKNVDGIGDKAFEKIKDKIII